MLIAESIAVTPKSELLSIATAVSDIKRSPLNLKSFAGEIEKTQALDNFAILKNIVDFSCTIPAKTDHFALILVHSGSCIKTSGRFEFDIQPKSLHFVSPQSIHAYRELSEDLNLSMLLFRNDFIAGSYIKESLLDQLVELSPVIPPYFLLSGERYEVFHNLFESIYKEYHSEKPFNLQFVKLLIVQSLYEMNRSCEACLLYSNRHLSRQYQLVTAFRKMVDEHFLSMRTVQEFADKLNVSAKYLTKVVKEETGQNALLIIHCRLHLEAKYLLSNSELTIKEVAYHLGFDTSSHFGRFFKHYSGINPTAFKFP